MKRAVLAVLTTLAAGALTGCPKPRTSAATQPTPVAFDPTASDPKALEMVDTATAKLGGLEVWNAIKELRFTTRYLNDGKVAAEFRHAWDHWNGRHNFSSVNVSTLGGDPDDVQYLNVKYDLFNADRAPYATSGGQTMMRDDAKKLATDARTHLAQDLYFLAMVYKARDPGVKLAVDNAEVKIQDSTACQPSCTSVKVTFDPAVGTDTWYINFNNESKLPEVVEKRMGAGRIGYEIQGWTEVDGLKFPSKLQNLGFKTEVIQFDGISIGSPDDATYMPSVGG